MKLQNKRGQNTAEYLIMLTLVAVGAITSFSVFGGTIKTKIALITSSLAGDATQYDAAHTRQSTNAQDANTRATSRIGMDGVSMQDQQYGQ